MASIRATLSSLMLEAGATCLANAASFKSFLLTNRDMKQRPITEQEVARTVVMMARTSSTSVSPSTLSIWGPQQQQISSVASKASLDDPQVYGQVWDVKIFVNTLNALQPKLDWIQIFCSLDEPGFLVGDERAFAFLLQLFHAALPSGTKFPLDAFWGKWNNIKGQISFLKMASQASTDQLNIVALSSKKILVPDMLNQVSSSLKTIASTWMTLPWNSYPFLETLVGLASVEPADDAKQLLDIASRQATELVLLGLVQIPQPWSPLHAEVALKLVTIFLMGHSSSVFVLQHVWQLNQPLMVESMVLLHSKDPNTLSRILDVAQELKVLPAILEYKQFPFVLDLAALASRREYLNLDKWLQNAIAHYGDELLKAVISFLHMKLIQMSHGSDNQPPSSIPLSEDVIMVIVKHLQNNVSVMSSESVTMFKETQDLIAQFAPKLANDAENTGILGNERSFPPEIEEEANSYYEKIYTSEMPIVQVVELLKRFKESQSTSEQSVFACMLHNLFDEYRFFHKYPDKELIMTGELFGALIQYQLISHIPLGVALRYVLEALRKPLGSKMFRFGLTALMQFQARLIEWPQYCSHILQIGPIKEAHPGLFNLVQTAMLKGSQSAHMADTFVMDALNGAKKPEVTATTKGNTNLDILLHGPDSVFDTPNEQTLDKILFIVNNLSPENMEIKIKELKPLLRESYFKWFSNYLVVKRASVELNFHGLYFSMIHHIGQASLYGCVLKETLSNVKVLLASEKTLTSSQERTLLKNLGSWLGGLTLARNMPIKHKDLALKDLLVEGFHKSRLIVVIPFVCKVLEQGKNSRVFRPPNPWTTALLKFLAELYTYADLKLNLKFEVEVLCKHLDVELKDIEPSNLLQLGNSVDYIDYQAQEEVPSRAMGDNMRQTGGQPAVSSIANPASNISIVIDDAGNLTLTDLASYVSFASNAALFNAHPPLKKLVVVAADRAIREIIGPVVERSISIATIASRELILKDFSNEPNEERMRRAAQLMVQNLASNLAMVTSKEPFRISMTNHLRSLLTQNGLNEPAVESLVQVTVQDNIDLGCAIIEKAAVEKAIPEIDEALAHAYLARRRQRERGLGWVEVQQYPNSRYPAVLPDPLRLRVNSNHQLRVYEDFGRLGTVPTEGPVVSNAPQPQVDDPLKPNPLAQVTEKFASMLASLENLVEQNKSEKLSSLPSNNELIALVRQLNMLASQFFVRDDLALWFSQKIVQFLFKTPYAIGLEIYIAILERICELSKRVAKELTMWLLFSDDERKFNVTVIAALIQSGLLNVLELDTYLAKQIETGGTQAVEFAAKLIQQCVCCEQPLTSYLEFYYSLEMLSKMYARGRIPDELNSIMDDLQTTCPGSFQPSKHQSNNEVKEKLLRLFESWIEAFQNVPTAEKEIDTLSVEHTVDTYRMLKDTPGGSLLSYQVVDALAKLFVLLLREDPAEIKVDRFACALTIIVLEIVHAHSLKREHFDQKPFFRIFTSVLFELQRHENQLTEYLPSVLMGLGRTFTKLEPAIVPGFVYAWLELISHRLFMPKLLALDNHVGWNIMSQLLKKILAFLAPFLRYAEMADPIRVLYKGLLRVLLLLLHDFPELLCDYHTTFCDVIPPSCVQLRNLILSAFPRNMRLPDPFTPNLKVDLLPDIHIAPVIASNYDLVLKHENLLADLDSFLSTRAPVSFLVNLVSKLKLRAAESVRAGTLWHVSMINALVIHVGLYAVQHSSKSEQKQEEASLAQSTSMQVFQQLGRDMDAEGRYHLLNAMANQLRYPNSHTHYFSCVLLYIFAEPQPAQVQAEAIREQITRVLLERLIVNRPHPWGLLITFIELLKNPRYQFWSHAFTRCAPDIERLFESVARSCMLPSSIANGEGQNQVNHVSS